MIPRMLLEMTSDALLTRLVSSYDKRDMKRLGKKQELKVRTTQPND